MQRQIDLTLPRMVHHRVHLLMSHRGVRLAVLLCCLLILAGELYIYVGSQLNQVAATDFYSYYTAAQAVRHGANPFAPVSAWIRSYSAGSPLLANYYVYAPMFALALVPFTLLPVQPAMLLWGICNVGFLLGAVYAILRAGGVRWPPVAVLALTVAVTFWHIIRIEIDWGQADILLAFLVSLALWVRVAGHPVRAGVLLAVACVIKPPLLVLIPFLLWKREFGFALSAVVGFLVLLLGPFLWLGRQSLTDQLTVWQFWSSQYVAFIDNQSPKGLLSRLFTLNVYTHPLLVAPQLATALWLAVVLVVVACTAAMVSPRPLRRDLRTLLEVGAVVVAMLLVSPLTEYIYLTILVVPMLAVLIYVIEQGVERRVTQSVALGLGVTWLLLSLPLQSIEYFFWPRLQSGSPIVYLYTLLAVPFLFVVVVAFGLVLRVLGAVSGQPLRPSIEHLFRNAVPSAQAWLDDAREWMTQRPPSSRTITSAAASPQRRVG